VSVAVTISLKGVPAVGAGVGRANAVAVALLTLKLAEEPVMNPAVAVNVVVSASYKVIDAVATPFVKVTDDPEGQVPWAG
jgi:hypothetical protein